MGCLIPVIVIILLAIFAPVILALLGAAVVLAFSVMWKWLLWGVVIVAGILVVLFILSFIVDR